MLQTICSLHYAASVGLRHDLVAYSATLSHLIPLSFRNILVCVITHVIQCQGDCVQVQGHGGPPKSTNRTREGAEPIPKHKKGIMVSPLVMHRQPLRAGQMKRNVSSHAYETRRKTLITSSSIFRGLSSLPKEELPKHQPDRIRAQSAEPVTRGSLHLSSGNYTGIAPALSSGGLKLPQFEEANRESIVRRMGVPATLVASQLMQSATPAGVHTGEDAVHYFSTNKHQSTGSLFIFCNFRNSNLWMVDPYSLVVVDSWAVAPEHCVVSCTGVCHIRPNCSGSTVSPLHKWAAEARQFRTLRRLTFFKKFAMVKAWAKWKTEHQDGKFARRAAFLQTQHVMLNAWFGDTMRACHRLV